MFRSNFFNRFLELKCKFSRGRECKHAMNIQGAMFFCDNFFIRTHQIFDFKQKEENNDMEYMLITFFGNLIILYNDSPVYCRLEFLN